MIFCYITLTIDSQEKRFLRHHYTIANKQTIRGKPPSSSNKNPQGLISLRTIISRKLILSLNLDVETTTRSKPHS